ncbi:TIGR03885 family FMN-dependent LLM class oxidoreductase [Mumia sp. zg.B53]|uniref:TIGR03885 family FMN-dependent LLM class oxidoreductase n=1 Tax=unclassified Mumia TaxID=2621872 RepID=UPI001C6F4281|nr:MULTISPECIES: TIGR03885 family FMN-dependent LLM class oxidoreductase [unclassified Mumia]MBW9215602.1 TIGR03885 family FMN-dependent LLM class oxidoreductase [Mumia sp. zg.B53]MDD9349839.1 TIGR03885 family FMN-dependent LLM class oxidoreductase [Mumia sp.]
MTRYGFHASHEQISPRQLLADVQHAERAGFQMAMCSDHFSPWSQRQGHSAFAWSWLGAALATTDLTFGAVSAPGQRYHPAVIAQAIGTLGTMFPGRFWVALGSGEAGNEHITGDRWPAKEVRTRRLEECVDVIRRLLEGEEVSHDGLVTVDRARLWDVPDPRPRLVGPAVSLASASRVAAWSEGMVTVNQPLEDLRKRVDAYREAGGAGPLALQVHLAWAPTEQEAEQIAHEQWRSNVFSEPIPWDLETPEAFDAVSEDVTVEKVRTVVDISSDLGRHCERLAEYASLGFDEIYLHHVGQSQERFLDAFGEHVIPQLKEG